MWVNRDQVSFEWFLSLLQLMEHERREYSYVVAPPPSHGGR